MPLRCATELCKVHIAPSSEAASGDSTELVLPKSRHGQV